ncbi:MAG TPA: alpha/beta fold hydrolase, partial [Candidatus Acidoferrales bacterium]|nr:alpha/beta fold hydrolase [Candidatus Acidoferrales bacterium]
MRFTRVNDVNLALYVYGHGAPVLMIMGLGGRAADWGSVPERIAHRFEAITFDNRGTGKSDKPDVPYNLDEMADEAVAVL